MKAWWILPAVVLGMAVGWLLATVLQDGAGIDVPEDGSEAVRRVAREASDTPREPRLIGAPPSARQSPLESPQPAASTESTTEEVEEILEFIGPGGMDEIVVWEQGESESMSQRGWTALLTLYAMAGRLEDFQRALPSALESGLEAPALLDLLRLLPVEKHVAAVDHVLRTWPELPWPVAALADTYTAAGAPDRAFEVLMPALEAAEDSDLARRLVAADPERAARVLGALGTGWQGGMLGEIGGAFVEAGRPDLALPFLQDALGRQPVNHAVLMSLSQVDPEMALGHARMLTQEHAGSLEVWGWLGELEMEAGNPEAAFAAWHESATRQLTAESLYGMMRADPERAYEATQKLTAETSDDEMLGAVAKVALKSGHAEDTMATLLRAHERDPVDHEWMVAMVALDPQRAAAVLEESAGNYEGESRDEVVGAYGNALRELGQMDAAFERFQEAFEADPSDWEWQRGLARTDPARALPLLEARRKEAGDEGDLIGALADAYAGTGQEAIALEHYQRAVDMGGGDEWYARMARVDPHLALGHLQRRTTAEPSAEGAWAALGDLHRELGNREAARAAYDRARSLNTTSLLYEIRWREMGG